MNQDSEGTGYSVRKFKVVHNNSVLTSYYWQKKFLFFGRWVPYKNVGSSNSNFAKEQIEKIDSFINSIHK